MKASVLVMPHDLTVCPSSSQPDQRWLTFASRLYRAKAIAHFKPSNSPYQKLFEGVWRASFLIIRHHAI